MGWDSGNDKVNWPMVIIAALHCDDLVGMMVVVVVVVMVAL